MPKGDRLKLKADPDDGTTKISHLLLEALAMARLSGLEKGAILFLWRRTYGWQDLKHPRKQIKERHISLTEWSEWLDCNKQVASKTLTKLTKHNIIIQTSLGQGKGYLYSMNTCISTWNGNCLDIKHLEWLLSKWTTVAQSDNSKPNRQQLPE